MATIAEIRVPASDTALGTTFDDIPSLGCEVEQVIAADDLGIWLQGANLSTLNAALDGDPTVVAHSVIRGDDESWLYNIEFSEAIAELFFIAVEERGTMLSATATNRRWTIRSRFPDREAVSCVYERLTERGVSVDITQIQSFSKVTTDEVSLTAEQHEALTAAIHYGYFEIPREISLEDLAAELGISHQALSERLRRAYRTLVTVELDFDKELERQFTSLR